MKIIRTTRYSKDLRRLGMSTEEAEAIETAIASHPEAGDVIKGLKGVRKLRFGLRKKGKSGGGRAIYLLMLGDDAALLLSAYSKKEKSELTPADRKAILGVLKELNDE